MLVIGKTDTILLYVVGMGDRGVFELGYYTICSWIKWSCKLYLEGKVQVDLIPLEFITCRRIHITHNGVSSVPYP